MRCTHIQCTMYVHVPVRTCTFFCMCCFAGSENNAVYVYSKQISSPMLTYQYNCSRGLLVRNLHFTKLHCNIHVHVHCTLYMHSMYMTLCCTIYMYLVSSSLSPAVLWERQGSHRSPVNLSVLSLGEIVAMSSLPPTVRDTSK